MHANNLLIGPETAMTDPWRPSAKTKTAKFQSRVVSRPRQWSPGLHLWLVVAAQSGVSWERSVRCRMISCGWQSWTTWDATMPPTWRRWHSSLSISPYTASGRCTLSCRHAHAFSRSEEELCQVSMVFITHADGHRRSNVFTGVCLSVFLSVCLKVKAFHTCYRVLGPELIPVYSRPNWQWVNNSINQSHIPHRWERPKETAKTCTPVR